MDMTYIIKDNNWVEGDILDDTPENNIFYIMNNEYEEIKQLIA